MTALSANIDATQTLIPVDGGLTNGSFQLPLYYTVDSEAVRVTGRAHRTTWLVERGIAGTTAATHSSAATLTRYYPEAAAGEGGGAIAVTDGTTTVNDVTELLVAGGTVTDEGGGVAGVAVQTRLLGPFPFTYQTAGIFTTGVALADLVAGQVVLDAWVVVTGGSWAGGGASSVVFEPFVGGTVANQAPGEAWSDGYYQSVTKSLAAAGLLGITPEPIATASYVQINDVPTPDVIQRSQVVCLEECVFGVLATPDAGTPTSGTAEVYALIAEPAA